MIHVPNEHQVRLRPVRDSRQYPPSYLETIVQLGSDYEQVRP